MPAIRNVAAAAMAAVSLVKATEVSLPPCLDPFQPFVYSGCFAEASGRQILPYRSPAQSSEMTVEKCVSECKGNGYRYAGLVYYGVCYCGQTVQGAHAEESECSLPCNGDKTETCGGNDNHFSIYQDPTFQPVEDVTISDYDHLGCWTDDSSLGRALTYQQHQLESSSMTTETCLEACKAGGFPFAGTQYGGECYCGVVIGNGTHAADASQCDMACNGDASQSCGGRSRLNLYAADELLSLEPCGYVPPVVSSSSVAPEPTTTSSAEPETTTSAEPETTTTSEEPETTTSAEPEPETTTTSVAPETTTSTTCTTSTTSVVSTTAPPTSTRSTSTTSTTRTTSSVCTTTTVTPPACEYKCGKWCSNPLPNWNSATDCKSAYSKCALQVASCFKGAGFPEVLECFNFGAWCSDVEKYCKNTPSGSKSSFCGRNPPKHPNPPKGVTSTITVPCASTSAKPTTSTTTQAPIPTPTNICKQPSNPYYGYGPGKPVAGIDLPIVTCNDLADQFPSYPWKLYNEPNSRNCKKYTRPQCSNACADACKEQYEDCIDVYAESCRTNKAKNKPRSYFEFSQASEMEKRTFGWNDNYNGAVNKCKAQYSDCLNTNKNINISGKCPAFGKY